jgi:hypothetical protein
MGKYLLQSIYLKPQWVPDPNAQPGQFGMKKIADDVLIEVIKDDETNTSSIKLIERPTIEFYTIIDENNCEPYNEMYIDKSRVETHVVEYSKRDLEICKYLGIDDEYKRLKSDMNKHYPTWEQSVAARDRFNSFMNEKVYKSPYIYGATVTIEEFYKSRFMLENGNEVPKVLNISFYDIETFIYRYPKEKVDQNNPKAPINVITYYNNKYNHFYFLILELEEIPDIQEVKNNLNKYIEEYIVEDFADMKDVSLNFEFFTSEVMMIRRFMNLIHTDKPDVAFAWNDNYDKKYIIGRMQHYKLNVSEEWCHPDIPEQYRRFEFREHPDRKSNPFVTKGKKGKTDPSRYWDKTLCPGYTLFVDQMSLYSNLRKRNIERTYKLDAIAEKVLGANKVDLHEFGLTIRNAPVKNFKIFLKYSGRDTKLLAKIEEKDRDVINYLMLTDNSDFWNGVNVSIVIKSMYYMRFLQHDQVIGNTIDYGVSESIEGAVVQDTELLDVKPLTINGKRSKIYMIVADYDAKSLYPSLMNQGKIGKENIKYRVMQLVDENNRFIMSGDEFNSMLQTADVSIIDLCNNIYGLPNIHDVIKDFEHMMEAV